MLIQPLDLSGDPAEDSSDVQALYDVFTRAAQKDSPEEPPESLRNVRTSWAYGMSAEPTETWTGRVDESSRVVGGYNLAFPTDDNTHLALLKLAVDPDERRQGHGRALLDHAVARVRSTGRRLLVGETIEPARESGSPGQAFAAAIGAERGLEEPTRALDLDAVDPSAHAELLAGARERSTGYSLLYWTGRAPEEHLDGVVALMTRMSDAPTENLEMEDEAWDRERFRAFEHGRELRGQRSYTVVARHDATCTLAGLTVVYAPEETSGWAFQGDTVVLPDHRGHRLGLLMKLSMLPWMAKHEPDVRRMVTGNAASNSYMIRINELMGHEVLNYCTEWQLRL